MGKIVTLLTDFGLKDTYVGQMKGVISGVCEDANIIDLTHDIEAQNIHSAGYLLVDAMGVFNDTSVHIAVVDPGVGSKRKEIAVKTEKGILIGPDNGLFTAAIKRYGFEGAVELNKSKYWYGHSNTFHGRDIFASIAGHLLNGVKMEAMGDKLDNIETIQLLEPKIEDEGIEGHVVLIDHFGNLLCDITEDDLHQSIGKLDDKVAVVCGGEMIRGIKRTFSDVWVGEAIVYIGSSMRLEIAVREGSAAKRFEVGLGDRITVKRNTL
ncbi:Adenosyl-chloride synthase [Poriferisphaera corsica]|uniref:Adenosyl-chloride synthase n=1 Tax=Poriferisphaera corsica TaxID=2528020 RepID=A0A517YSC3_9BACT|nr:SAM-dependent chlorinase/fluorinase [Poriferisphaera corsica]QDU33108.1 Adenosyl-chloride synthase [Poriferisphaera corsica]